jgi:hypothetical protein
VSAAINLINKQQAPGAIALLDRVVARFPQKADTYFFRGFAKLKTNNTTEGKADLEKYVAMAPADAPQLAQAKELLSKIK